MAQENTVRKLADMTDEGEFERLATAILRQSDIRFRNLSHPGVNADGKTVKSPVDAIAFVPKADPPEMIAVHHTICAAKDLEKKWLHDPATVSPRGKGNLPTAPAGDVVKTIAIVAQERKRTPDLQATLILTTNQEPGETLVRDIHAAGTAAGIAIEIWARSRLADVLDNEPRGQWLRSQFLNIVQVQLSEEMLRELSTKSLKIFSPPDRQEAWVKRSLDEEIKSDNQDKIVFIIAESGSGKSVVCYKRLISNLTEGGFSLILTDEVVASSFLLEQAIEKTLMQIHPSLLTGCGSIAMQLSNPTRRLLLTIEDVNRSGRGASLIEKIARWQGDTTKKDDAASWQLICPVWPQVMSSLSDDARRRINSRVIAGAVFSASEGTEAVERRRALNDTPVTKLEAAIISEALGHDPLLIALSDPTSSPDTTQTIGQFIEVSLQRIATARGEFSAGEYRKALLDVAKVMLLNRQLEPSWADMLASPSLAGHAAALRHVIHQGDIVRLAGPSTAEKLAFRHDRVREWLLARAAFDLIDAKAMPEDIASEPYFAEVFGLALARDDASGSHVAMLAAHNPLALFCSVRHFCVPASPKQTAVLAALETWLDNTSGDTLSYRSLSWEAIRMLAESEGPNVIPLVARFKSNSWDALRARYRNGDLMGGIGLCLLAEPGVGIAGHDVFLEHVKARFGAKLIHALVETLKAKTLDEQIRIGALRLAGHIGEPTLANAIRASWCNHENRQRHLAEYLWASAQCIDDDPVSLLGPVCDAWAELPGASEDKTVASARENLAADHLRWAFRKRLPADAVLYFIERAATQELKWPITYMLHGLDQPDAVEFVVRQLAGIEEKLEGTNSFSPFSLSATHDWESMQERSGRAMSDASRNRLLRIWQDQSIGKHLRKQAFRIWASTHRVGDIEELIAVQSGDELAETALWQRLRRGDREAIPAMIAELSADSSARWWHLGSYIWSAELTNALDGALELRGTALSAAGPRVIKLADTDAYLSESLMRLPHHEADKLLKKHWHQLSVSHYYIIAGLYVATPTLQANVAALIKVASNPREILQHLSQRFGHHVGGHPGIYRPEQIEAVLPYLDLLDEMSIDALWTACNEHGWFDLRRTHLDARLPSNRRGSIYLDDARVLSALDDLLARNGQWIDVWLDDFLKSGAALDDVMAILGRWLNTKRDLEALQLASCAVMHIGERRHLELLRGAEIEPAQLAAAIIADTDFGVKRRTLGA